MTRSVACTLILALIAAPCVVEAQPRGRLRKVRLPLGTVGLLRNYRSATGQESVAGVAGSYEAPASDAGQEQDFDWQTVMEEVRAHEGGADGPRPINTTQAAITAATLALTGSSIGFAGSTLRLIAGILSQTGSTIALPVSAFRRSASRIQYTFATYTFGQQLYSDFNNLIQSRDNLGTAARYIKQYNELRRQLTQAGLLVQTQMQQANTANEAMQAVVRNYAAAKRR